MRIPAAVAECWNAFVFYGWRALLGSRRYVFQLRRELRSVEFGGRRFYFRVPDRDPRRMAERRRCYEAAQRVTAGTADG